MIVRIEVKLLHPLQPGSMPGDRALRLNRSEPERSGDRFPLAPLAGSAVTLNYASDGLESALGGS